MALRTGFPRRLWRVRLAGLLAAVALAATACAGGAGGAGGGQEAGSPGRETISIGIDLPVHPFFNYLAVKSEKYFGDTPWKLDMQVYSAQAQVSEMVQGNLDVITSPAFAMPRIEKQAPQMDLQYFWPMARYVSWSGILVPSDSPIRTFQDLKGKSLAAPPLKSEHGSEIAAIYGATGMSPDKYFDFVQTEQPAAALQTGRVDAALLDPIGKQKLIQSGKYRQVIDLAGIWKMALGNERPVLSGGYIAKKSFLDSHRDFVRKFVQVNREIWLKFMRNEQFRQQVYQVAGRFAGVPPKKLHAVAKGLGLLNLDPKLVAVLPWDAKVYSRAFEWARKGGFPIAPVEDAASKFLTAQELGLR